MYAKVFKLLFWQKWQTFLGFLVLFCNSGISLNWGVFWQPVSAAMSSVTRSPTMWKMGGGVEAKNKRHIWQRVHFLNLVGLIFFFLSRSLFFFCVDLLLSFFFFLLLFPWVLLASQGTRIFPQNVVLKAEPLFPATGNERGGWVVVELGWGLTSWLPVQGLCQCEKKQRRLIWWLWKCVCPRERVQLD